jgi:hypothetical protein
MVCMFATAARAQQPPPPSAAAASAHAEAQPVPGADPALESAGVLAGRLVAEALMGSGLATVGFLAGPELGAANCRRCLFAAGFAGANATFPLGVYWGGHLVDGEGSFWLTVAAPWVVSATAWTALVLDKSFNGKLAFEIATIGGAVAAPVSVLLYEITNARRRRSSPAESTGSCPQVALSTRRGGMALHLGGRF